jgi:hypothetical protein
MTGSTAVEQRGAAGERVAARAAAAGASSGTVGQQAVRVGWQSVAARGRAARQHGGAKAGVRAVRRRACGRRTGGTRGLIWERREEKQRTRRGRFLKGYFRWPPSTATENNLIFGGQVKPPKIAYIFRRLRVGRRKCSTVLLCSFENELQN